MQNACQLGKCLAIVSYLLKTKGLMKTFWYLLVLKNPLFVPFWQVFDKKNAVSIVKGDRLLAFVLRVLIQCRADNFGTEDIPVGGLERLAVIDLQVSRQGQHEKPVYRSNRNMTRLAFTAQ